MEYLPCYLQQISPPVILCLVQADPALPERPAVLVDPYCLDLSLVLLILEILVDLEDLADLADLATQNSISVYSVV